MYQKALIIFIKNPIKGKVKTRLAQNLGEVNALKIYQKLLLHTCSITKDITITKYVFYSDFVEDNDPWENEFYNKEVQSGSDLGERMKSAFALLFQRGFKEIIIIGSDCYELTNKMIITAFDKLHNSDVVIGPAKDGGYYLLGLRIFLPQIFDNKTWSSSNVFRETIKDIRSLNHTMHQLPVLSDVDEAKDVTFEY